MINPRAINLKKKLAAGNVCPGAWLRLPSAEIAEIMGLSVTNVKVKLHRARKNFRAILEEHCSFEVDERSVLVCDPKEEEP